MKKRSSMMQMMYMMMQMMMQMMHMMMHMMMQMMMTRLSIPNKVTYSVNGDGGYVADVSYTGEAQVFFLYC